ncbi:MAG: hypothetical protein ACTHQQ_16200 [Solirubrobacteraceae bacterium]
MSRRLEDVRLTVIMLDGMEIAERPHVVALGITTGGVTIRLALGKAAPRTLRSRVSCSQTWSSGGWILCSRSCS